MNGKEIAAPALAYFAPVFGVGFFLRTVRVLWLQGITIRESIPNRDPVSGAVYAASLVLFALIPLFVNRPPINPSTRRLR